MSAPHRAMLAIEVSIMLHSLKLQYFKSLRAEMARVLL